MLKAQIASRGDKKWLHGEDLEKMFKGQYFLHSTCVQSLAQKLDANIATARELRRQQKQANQEVTARFPYREKTYQTVVWKASGIHWTKDDKLSLSNRRGTPPLVLTVPKEYKSEKICKAELTWRADHYELCLTIDTGIIPPEPKLDGKIAGIDLGEIHIAAVSTEDGDTLLESGRALRSIKQLRNKRRAAYDSLLSRCKQGSKRHRRLLKSRTRAGAKCYRQQRDILHKASRHVVKFCGEHGVDRIAVGDVRDIQDGVNLGKKTNQKISQWVHGKFKNYLTYKSSQYGVVVDDIPEDYSTRTCSCCGHVHKYAPRGRVHTCSSCSAVIHRDLNGACNIASRAKYGSYGYVQVATEKYLRPLRRSRAFDAGLGKKFP
ncbi:MAG: RNA-guided endonuclease InsQ/TnpB family protein [Chloroflexota bacterium]